jgi:ubiquitin-like-conjugating enzyme ATG10
MLLLFSRQDFETSARALIQACSHQSSSTSTATTVCTSTSTSFPFTNWQVTESSEHGGGGGGATIYLTHPPVTQEVSKSFLSLEQQEDDDNNMLVDEFLLQDDSILVDDNCDNDNEIESLSSVAVSISTSISNNNNNNNNNNTPIVKVIWNLSVVYSETFQVPVLYFTLEYTNGCPVERRPMVSLLLNMDNNNDNDDDNDWSRVSQDLHPETGRPSYFLHPCQTNDTLHNMMITAATTTITCPSIWMWTWMSVVLPAIGHGIPSKYFLDIQQRLLQVNAQVNA